MALRPKHYAGGADDEDDDGDDDEGGGGWNVCGEIYAEHPARRVGEGERAMLDVWKLYRMSSMGTVGHLPETGGILDQPAKIMQGLDICDGAGGWCDKFIPRPKPEAPPRRRRRG